MKNTASQLFSNIKLYTNDSSKKYSFLKDFKTHGGIIARSEKTATHILTDTEIYGNHVNKQWILECIKNQKIMPIDQDSESTQEIESPRNLNSLIDDQKTNAGAGVNELIISQLTAISKMYHAAGDVYRSAAYRKAIAAIKKHGKEIKNGDQAMELKGVGTSIAASIDEIIENGVSSKTMNINEKTECLLLFKKIYGVGDRVAQAWYNQGFRTLEDLQSKAELTQAQRIYLKYLKLLDEKIPRQIVHDIGAQVSKFCKSIDSSISLEIMGSYRRGEPVCGDVDVIIYSFEKKIDSFLLEQLIKEMESKEFVVGTLALGEKFQGIVKHDEKYYRLDIWIVQPDELGAARIHFTGNDMFNRSMRLAAQKQGLTLNEHGLFIELSTKDSKRGKGENIAGPTEKSIFEALRIPFRPPEERYYGF